MWIWRRMLKISWRDKMTNEEVLKRVGETRSMLRIIHRRKCRWIGHILRHDGLLHNIIEGTMVGRGATRGRSMIGLLHDIVEGGTYEQLKEKALDRTVWKRGLIGVP